MSGVSIRDYKPEDKVILSIQGVNRIYKDEENEVTALSDINLDIKKGEFMFQNLKMSWTSLEQRKSW